MSATDTVGTGRQAPQSARAQRESARAQRESAHAQLESVRAQAEALIAAHLPGGGWSFGFDNARTRAGQCDFGRARITLSRHLAVRADGDTVEQVLLHEIAHALTGPRAAHNATWRATARRLGYRGSRLHDGPIAADLAPWVGRCPAGHEHVRYRRPNRPTSCARCARSYDPANAIRWEHRGSVRPQPAAGLGGRTPNALA